MSVGRAGSGADGAHEHRDDLAAYALGALASPERERVEAHLAECEACESYVRWLAPAVDLLPASVEQVAPPERLGANLMATVRADAESRRREARTIPRQSRRGLLLRPATGLAAAGAVVIGVVAGYVLHDPGADGATTVAATPTAAARPGTVDATLRRQGDMATLTVDRIPALRRDQVYELWVQRSNDEMVPSGTFVPDRGGRASAAVDPASLPGGDAVLVTAEHRPGAQQPHTAPILTAPLE